MTTLDPDQLRAAFRRAETAIEDLTHRQVADPSLEYDEQFSQELLAAYENLTLTKRALLASYPHPKTMRIQLSHDEWAEWQRAIRHRDESSVLRAADEVLGAALMQASVVEARRNRLKADRAALVEWIKEIDTMLGEEL